MNKITIYLVSNNIANKRLINDKNNDNIEYRIRNLSLNKEGIDSAIKISKCLDNINYIYSSTYNTAIETANYLSIKFKRKVRLDNRLDLRKIGINKLSELPNYYYEQSFLDSNYKLMNGESQEEVRNRMYSFISEVLNKHNNKNIVIVTHSVCILYLLKKWCIINYDGNAIFNNKQILNSDIKDPNIFKLDFEKYELKAITKTTI